MIKKYFIPSDKNKIYLELNYPKNIKLPASAVVIAHGLRSYYPGFLDIFAKAIRQAGYISVKFHYVGTGKSSGKFEHKSTTTMLKNYKDILNFLKKHADIKNLGIMARSNSANLATLAGPDPRIKAYVFLAPPAFYSLNMGKFVTESKIKSNYFYHKSFKRPHTNGPGRLPLGYMRNLKKYDQPLLKNISKMKPVIFFQSTEDEAVPIAEGHYDYWLKHLPNPKKMVLIKGGNHSYKGHKKYVIDTGVRWLRKYLK
ncbi:MAG: alpha/beta hydrolase [bacterium]|nr:alpha/beta hydrolase [bacterium]